ncbi:MAG: MarR family transcriptional regulator [Solirubrobacterales bacterium]|nr:MarR family transcriptional regulator [Solirubrobacterales bacterium]
MARGSSPSGDAELARLGNLLGAWALAVADRVEAATSTAADRGGQAPAALVALHEFAGGGTIEDLRRVLGLTHSAVVRLVDGLVGDGHVTRRPGAGDARSVALILTASGRAAARGILRARARAVEATLAGLPDAQRRSLTALAERLTGDLAELRLEERRRGTPPTGGWLCRLCDFEACGRPAGRCPAAARAAVTATS